MNILQHIVLFTLRWAAIAQLKKNRPLIIGVTGSAGKSSTVNAIARVVEHRYKTKQTNKGNSETGIPFEILSIPVKPYVGLEWAYIIFLALWRVLTYWPKHQVFVVEMGIDSDQSPKNMSYLLSIVQPTIGIFLNVNSVHGANFTGEDTLQAIANEKGKLLTSLPAHGLAVYSADHPQIVSLSNQVAAKKQLFSLHQHTADATLRSHQVDTRGTTYAFTFLQKSHTLVLSGYCLPAEFFRNFAAALLVGNHLGIPVEQGMQSLEAGFTILPGRMSVIEGIHDSTILDSSYNASLEPMLAALELLKQIPTTGKRIAVLGDMREIGKNEQQDHEAVATKALSCADQIILVGPLMKTYALPLLPNAKAFDNAYQATEAIKTMIEKNDLVLVKGSQNTIFLEIVVKGIMEHPEQAVELLCRQSPYWEKQRQHMLTKLD